MKKYFTIIAALFAIAAVSCQKETALLENNKADEIETLVPAGEMRVFSASLPDAPESRSILGVKDGSVYHPLWVANDSIVVNGVLSGEAQISNGGQSANFAVAVPDSSAYIAIAPGRQIRNTDFRYHEGSYDFLFPGAGKPQRDTLDEGGNPTFDPRVCFLAGYGTDNNLSFRHLNVYFRITTTAGTDDDNIRYVYIRDADPAGDGYIAGVWTVTYSGSGISLAPKTRSSVVAFDAGEAGLPQGTPMIVALPAYDYPEGLIVTIKDINGHFISFKIKSSKTQFSALAGTVYEFSREFSPDSGTISTAEEWNEFAAAINKNKDFEIYKWVGNGTVKIGADIETDNLTKITPKKFPYNVDGQSHTITRTAATGALFRNVRGTISNLNLAGTLSSVNTTFGALADSLYASGLIRGCTNSTNMTVNAGTVQTGTRAGGFVGIMTGGMISGCTNTGSLYASITIDAANSKSTYNLQVGGIVGQIDGTQSYSGDVVLYNCKNTGAVTADPFNSETGHNYAVTYAGVGGIAGWLRGTEHSFVLNNCDNTGTITYSAEHITSTTGTAAKSISVGGIVGIAAHHDGGGYEYKSPGPGTNGLNVIIRNCDNSGTVHNCGDNYATTTQSRTKVYTGGIAGSFVGSSSSTTAIMAKCTNTGTLLPYDLTGSGKSTRPLYCQVVGGLIGYGGHARIDSCKVNCTIGNGKRQTNAIAGGIGFAVAPFMASRDTVWFTGYFVGTADNEENSATFAVVPKKFASSSLANPAPTVTGSTISNCVGKATLYHYTTDQATATTDFSASFTDPSFTGPITLTMGSEDDPTIVRGHGYITGATIRSDVTFTDNVTQDPS